MAECYMVDRSFWNDPKVQEDFTPEDRYLFLYLITCSLANISGCYEIGIKTMSFDTGYEESAIKIIIERLSEWHKVIEYDFDCKEVLIKNWWKYHWTTSPNYVASLREKIAQVRTDRFKRYLSNKLMDFLTSNGTNIDDLPPLKHLDGKIRPRTGLSLSTRMDVLDRDRFTCRYCGRSAPDVVLEVDHIYPVSRGGTNDMSNLITACVECNRGKRDRILLTNIGEEP